MYSFYDSVIQFSLVRFGSMAQWFNGWVRLGKVSLLMIQWFHGSIVQWFHGWVRLGLPCKTVQKCPI